jgi:hypothetical protein
MSKASALEEMYLIYMAFRNYLVDAESWGEYDVEVVLEELVFVDSMPKAAK